MSPAGLLLLGAGLAGAAEPRQLPPPPEPSTSSVKVDFSADRLDYESSSATILLRGHVRVVESTVTIKADELRLDTRTRRARSEGFLLIEDGESAVAGRSGEFDLVDRTGRLEGASAAYGSWRIHAKRVRLGKGRRLDYSGADFTSCSLDPKPHYHFHSSRVSVVPKKRLLAWNTLFYLGPVPILYTPVLYKSLDPSSLIGIKFQPGYDRRNGPYLKGTLTTEHGPHLYSKLFLDYYASQGLGTGAELQRRKGEDSKGGLYGYRIRETHNGRERWALLGGGYEALSSSIALQARLQLQSDADFNNHYARSSLFRVTPELINDAALVYRRPQWTTRLSYSRRDEASADKTDFLKAKESSPRLEVQSASLRLLRLPWLNSFNGFADNSFDRGRTYVEKSVGAGWEGTRTIPLVKGVSLTPRAAYRQTYYDRVDQAADFGSTRTFTGAFVGRYAAQGTLRVGSPLGDWDLTHLHERRQRPDAFADDAGAPDHGVETNLLTLTDAVRPSRKVLVRAFSGYDFRVFRDRTLGFRERVQPIVAEVYYTPRPALNLSVRNDYRLEDGNRSFLLNAFWGDELGTHLGGGAGNNISEPGKYLFNAELGYAPSTGTWRAAAALRSEAATPAGPGRISRFHLFEKELTLAKTWHDFYTRVLVRFRPGGVKEVNLRLDLRFGGPADRVPKKDWEAEWFPDRRGATTP